MCLSALYISAQLTGFYRDTDLILFGWFLRCRLPSYTKQRQVLAEEGGGGEGGTGGGGGGGEEEEEGGEGEVTIKTEVNPGNLGISITNVDTPRRKHAHDKVIV